MSVLTVALPASTAETVRPSALGFGPATRLEHQLDAEHALAQLERDVQRIARHLDPSSTLHPRIPRGSRRSAWVPTL